MEVVLGIPMKTSTRVLSLTSTVLSTYIFTITIPVQEVQGSSTVRTILVQYRPTGQMQWAGCTRSLAILSLLQEAAVPSSRSNMTPV